MTNSNLQKAFQFHQKNDFKEAEKFYLKALEENKMSADANNLLGLLYFQQNDCKNAEIYIKMHY